MSGTIPPQLLNCPECRLKILDFRSNNFTGAIPPTINKLTNLLQLSLDQNRLSGTIPIELGALGKLQSLFLGNNSFSNLLPVSFRFLTSLRILDLSNNRLESPLPANLFSTMLALTQLDLSSNILTFLDNSIGSLPELEDLVVSKNQYEAAESLF